MIGSAIGRIAKGWRGNSVGVTPETKAGETGVTQNSGLQANTNNPGSPAYLANEPFTAEQLLIERCKVGDQAAFASLVNLHQDYVYNLAYRILQNHEEADDATQEAFVKIWQALPNFRGEAKFSTWLYRIVHNLCLNRLRSAKSAPQTVSVEFNWHDEGEREIIANLPGDPIDDPALRFDSAEQRKLLWREVDKLPAKYRSIITLYYAQEFSYEEIAAVLEVPVGTVKTHLYRAKAQLRDKLKELTSQGVLELA